MINIMHKSENTILIWVLIWAGLLLALLYSPIGSPNLYNHTNYFTENQGVNFNNLQIGKGSKDISIISVIKNAPKVSSENLNIDDGLNIPIEKNVQKRKYNYSSVSGSVKSYSTKKPIITFANKNNIKSNHVNVERNESGTYSESSGEGSSVAGISNSFNFSKRSQNNSNFQDAGVNVSGADLSLFGDSTLRKLNNARQKLGGGLLDPFEDPLNEPIPVSDGWCFLIVLASIYSIYILLKRNIIHLKFL